MRPNRLDALIAAGFVAWALIEVIAGGVRGSVAVNVAASLMAAVPLAWRRSAAWPAALVCAGGLALKTALGLPLDGLALLSAILVAAYSVGRHEPPRRAALTALGMTVLAWLSLFGLPPIDQSVANYPFIALWVGGPAVAGGALRAQVRRAERLAQAAARAEMHREEHVRRAVAAERGRIAREVHDTVAHAVSVMVLHAGAVRSRLPDKLLAERVSLGRTEDAGRQAIAELRRLLGVLREDDELAGLVPQPTLADLERLAADARRDGLPVVLEVVGDRRPLDPSVEVSALRIVQEALTNVRKHARATTAIVRIDFGADCLRVQVFDDGVGICTPPRSAEGFGLIGIRERVDVFGGTMSLRTPDAGGLMLDVALPVGRP